MPRELLLERPGAWSAAPAFQGDRSFATWRSRQNGGNQLGAGCFEGIRNLAAHEHELDLPEQVALEQLAAFSLLARWIDECDVDKSQLSPDFDSTNVEIITICEGKNLSQKS